MAAVDPLECICLHFRKDQNKITPLINGQLMDFWTCIDCGSGLYLRRTVQNWIDKNGGRSQCKLRIPRNLKK